MAYFQRKMDGIERGGKIAADVFCVLLLAMMAVGCLGVLPGSSRACWLCWGC